VNAPLIQGTTWPKDHAASHHPERADKIPGGYVVTGVTRQKAERAQLLVAQGRHTQSRSPSRAARAAARC
jgi:hypothetical protein